MRKLLASLVLILAGLPAYAQDVPNHSVPIGGGPGVVGWRSVGPCSSSQFIVWQGGAGADPTCGNPTVNSALTDTHILVGVAGTATDLAMSNDCTMANTGAITCTKTNGVALTSAATTAIGTAGATIPLLNGNNTWSGTNGFGAITTTTIGGTAITGSGAVSGNTLASTTTTTVGTNALLTTNNDTGIARTAAGVVQINNGTIGNLSGTYIQWGGAVRLAANLGVTSSTVFVNSNLSVNVVAGRTYAFDAWLPVAYSGSAGGAKAAISGTATATSIIYDGYHMSGSTLAGQARGTALGTTVGAATPGGTTGDIYINGTITVATGGTLLVQFAQNVSNVNTSFLMAGAYFRVYDMP